MSSGLWIAIAWGGIVLGTAIGYLILEFLDHKAPINEGKARNESNLH